MRVGIGDRNLVDPQTIHMYFTFRVGPEWTCVHFISHDGFDKARPSHRSSVGSCGTSNNTHIPGKTFADNRLPASEQDFQREATRRGNVSDVIDARNSHSILSFLTHVLMDLISCLHLLRILPRSAGARTYSTVRPGRVVLAVLSLRRGNICY